MKLTKSTLKQIIKEEVEKIIQEEEEWWEAAGLSDEDVGATVSRKGMPEMSKEDEISGNERRDMFKVLMDPKVSPDQKRRTINKAWKDGLFGDPKSKEAKAEWRRLRRKHHRKQKRKPRALDRMEKDPVPTLTPPKKGQKAPAIYKNKAAVKRAVKRGAMAPDEAKLAREWEAADTPAKQAALKKKYGIK